ANPTDALGTDLPGLTNVVDQDDAFIRVARPGMMFIARADGVADGGTNFVAPGTNVVFSYLVFNNGDSFLTDFVITDSEFGTAATFNVAVPPGVPFPLVATQFNVTANMTNVATVSARTADSLGRIFPLVPPVIAQDDSVTFVLGPGSAGDRVWNDLDHDGVQDAGEPGLPLIAVQLYQDVDTDGMAEPGGDDGAPLSHTVTDVNGNYSFAGLPAADYFVTMTVPEGWVVSPKDVGSDTLDSDFDPTHHVTDVFAVAAGQAKNDVDGGLTRPGSWCGAVFWDLNDDGRRQVTEPAFRNMPVRLNPGGRIAYSDRDGRYRFDGMLPGTYTAEIDTNVLSIAVILGAHFNNPSAMGSVSNGMKVAGVDFGLLAGNTNLASVGDFVWHDTDMDGRQDPGEVGLGGVEMNLIEAGPDRVFGTFDDLASGVSTTFADGFYLFENVPTGIYQVAATTPPGLTPVSGPQSYAGVSPALELNPGDTRLFIDFGFSGLSGSIGDRVWFDVNGDGTADPGEPGLPNVTIELRHPLGGVFDSTTTDENGLYRFSGLTGGTYVVEISDQNGVLAGMIPSVGFAHTDNQSQVRPYVLTIPPGTVVDFADFGLTLPLGSIGNQVFDDVNRDGLFDPADDFGLPGIEIGLFDENTNLLLTAQTTLNGTYLFPNIPNGSYQVQVLASSVPPFMILGPITGQTNDHAGKLQPYPVTVSDQVSVVTADFGYDRNGILEIGDTVYYDQNSNGVFDI
ncbi:MAG: SdrD B-like domain-containing protein, partial [Verrucomicrobiota bacterium]